MTNKPNIVLILKSGGDFKITDVYLLVAHINRYWQNKANKPNIYCYTDFVTEEREVVGLTLRPLPNLWKGWWSKMNLFAPQLKELRPFLYMDLDTAIVNTIDSLIPPQDAQTNFVTLRDFYRPLHLASGLMWIPDAPVTDKIYSEWLLNTEVSIKKYKGDQNFIESVAKKADLYWQDIFGQDYITTFKPNRQWRMTIPPMSAVICFHGEPRIPTAALTVEWVKNYVSYAI